MQTGNTSSEKSYQHQNPVLQAILQTTIAAEFIRQQIDSVCSKFGINGTQYNVLRILKRNHPKGSSRGEILAQLIEKSVDVTRVIDSLEKKGYVERSRTTSDRRLSLSMITESGITLLTELDAEFLILLKEIGNKLSPEGWQNLSQLCQQLHS